MRTRRGECRRRRAGATDPCAPDSRWHSGAGDVPDVGALRRPTRPHAADGNVGDGVSVRPGPGEAAGCWSPPEPQLSSGRFRCATHCPSAPARRGRRPAPADPSAAARSRGSGSPRRPGGSRCPSCRLWSRRRRCSPASPASAAGRGPGPVAGRRADAGRRARRLPRRRPRVRLGLRVRPAHGAGRHRLPAAAPGRRPAAARAGQASAAPRTRRPRHAAARPPDRRHAAAGLRLSPADPDTTVGRVDVWADPPTGLPLHVEVAPKSAPGFRS